MPEFGATFAPAKSFFGRFFPAVHATADDKSPFTGVPGTYKERTFIAIKPDGVQRQIVGEIIARFEKKGYKLAGIKMVTPTKEFAAKHYDDLKTKPFFPGLINYFSSGPVVAMVWEGRNVIVGGRKLVGATRPDEALPGSIRGDLCVDTGRYEHIGYWKSLVMQTFFRRNIIHGSDSAEAAQSEIALWFKEGEVQQYTNDSLARWVNERN